MAESEPRIDESPPSWYWWVVNVYQPNHRELQVRLEGIESEAFKAIARLEKLLWAIMVTLLTVMGGIVAILAERGAH